MSSPRQKMVVVVPPQPSELEQRKKRQTLERARANHLSKQLQMRLQYAKLKVEHGWQRQNLNEVENLYFHHSHLRSMRQSGAAQPSQYAAVTYTLSSTVPVPAETQVGQSSAPSGVPDRTAGPSPSANDLSPSGSVSPPQSSSLEPAHSADGRQSHLAAVQTPVPVLPASTVATNRPPSVLDLSDPNILARLVQLQAQVQLPSQSQSQTQVQTVSRHPQTTIPPSTQPGPVPVPILAPSAFAPHPINNHTQPSFVFGAPTPGSVPLYPPAPSQQPIPTSASAPTPIPTTPIPTPTPIASSALTYDSFWSTHASSTGSSRALYRTHTGFTASVTPGGNVAMLTPGGHTAVMTAEGVYVGGATK